MTTLEALEPFEPEGFEKTSDSRNVLQVMADVAVRAFSMMPKSAPEYLSEHFDHSTKRNELDPQFSGRVV